MITVSDAYKELVKSNIRPKCEPVIKVSGKDNNGNDIELIWKAKNIKDLKYKRGVDPVGRELPYMELTWTEIYTGKLNAESYPEKYNNVTQYMAVELSFIQDLGFYNTWKTIFNSGTNWKELFSKNSTWKQIKNNVSQEVITMPKLFLSARPTISGQTITWVAKDFLNLLNNPVLDDLNPATLEIPFFNPLETQMYESAYSYYNNILTIFNVLIQSHENVEYFASYRNKMLKKRIIADNTMLKEFILNYLNLGNFAITFKLDGSFEINDFGLNGNASKLFLKRNMYNLPNIQKISNISVYDFKNYSVEMDKNANYTKSYTDKIDDYLYIFNFNKYGTVLPEYNNNRNISHELTYALSESSEDIVVTPLNFNGYDNELNSGLIGEIYTENNPLNPFSSRDEEIQERFELLKGYFNSNVIVADFETLPDFSVEPYDGCKFETNLFQNSEELVKLGIVISSEISYNGAWKEKFIVHDATYMSKG